MSHERRRRHPPSTLPRAGSSCCCDPGTFRPLRTAVGDGVAAGSGRVDGRPVSRGRRTARSPGRLARRRGRRDDHAHDRAGRRAGAPVVGFPHSGGARLQEGAAALTAYAAIFRAQAHRARPADLRRRGRVRRRRRLLARARRPDDHGRARAPGCSSPARGWSRRHARAGHRRGAGRPAACTRATASPTSWPPTTSRAAELVRDRARAPARRRRRPAAAGAAGCAARPATRPDRCPPAPAQVYDVRDVADRLVDGGALLELAPRWARNLVVGFARIEGSPVGVIANQPRHLGGCLDAAAAEKGAWFVELCDRFSLPLVVLVDTPGFLPGTAPGARRRHPPRGRAAGRVCARTRAPCNDHPPTGLWWGTHRHELPRPRSRR